MTPPGALARAAGEACGGAHKLASPQCADCLAPPPRRCCAARGFDGAPPRVWCNGAPHDTLDMGGSPPAPLASLALALALTLAIVARLRTR